MKKGVQKVLTAGAGLLLLLAGACVESDVGDERKGEDLLPVEIPTGVSPLQVTTPVDTKSLPDTTRSEALADSLPPVTRAGEATYKRAIVLQYKGGVLVNGGSTDMSDYTIGSSVSASLQAAEGCNIYVLAVNETSTTGGNDVFSTEEKLNGAAYDLYGLFSDPADNDIPLAGSLKNVDVVRLSVGGTESGVIRQGSGESKVELSRIAARLNLELLYSVPGYKVIAESGRIKNVPSKMYYSVQPGDLFPAEEAAGAFTEVPFTLSDCDGDNNDQPATKFTRYLPANIRGTNPEVTLPREKYSGTAPKTATDCCTYVSFIAEEKKNTVHTLSYSFYLGGNTTSDFNIRRNYIYTISSTIAQTGEGDLRVSEEGISPELETDPLAQAVAAANAMLRATLATYGTSVSEYGFYYKKDTPFEDATGATKAAATNLSEGAYTAVLNGLAPKTVYYFRAYAVCQGQTLYGSLSSFSTNAEGVPVLTVENALASASNGLTASSSGNTVTGAGILSQGIVYSPTSGFNNLTAGIRVAGQPAATSPFSVAVNDLTKGTTYYYRYFASNAQGYVYSATERNFRTKDTPSAPTGGSVASTVVDQLTFAATLPERKNPADDYPTAAGVKYWTNDPGSDLSSGSTLSFDAPSATGAKSVNWTGMAAGQPYWYTFYSTNGAGSVYSTKQTFTSSAVLPAPNPSTKEIGPQAVPNAFAVTTARNTTATVSGVGATIASGNGSASKSITMVANTATGGSRTATLTFSTAGEYPLRRNTMTISQGGVVFSSTAANVPNVPKEGKTATEVSVSSNIPWQATSSQSWCTIGNGNQTGANTKAGDTGKFTYTVAKNEGGARDAKITIQGTGSFTGFTKEFTVSQLSGTWLNIDRNDMIAGPQEGNHTLKITSNTSWTLASDNTGIATVGAASGENNKDVIVTVKANTTLGNTSSRVATITAKPTQSIEKGYKITQYGVAFPASFASVANIVKGGQGATSVNVLANIPWEAISSAPDWCTIGNGSQTGSNTKDGDTRNFTYTVKTNTGIARTATITVKGTGSFAGISRTFTVSQLTGTELSINLGNQAVGPQASSHTLGITSNTSWTLTSNNTNVATVVSASGTNNANVGVTVKENTASGSSRTATITATPTGNTAKSYTITQYGVAFSCTQGDVPGISKDGRGATPVYVTANIPWTATSSDASWCTITSGSQTGANTQGGSTNSFNYAVSANNGGARSATITIRGTGNFGTYVKTFTVSQEAGGYPSNLRPNDPNSNNQTNEFK